MEIVLSAVLSELTTRSINFFINKISKPTAVDVEDRLRRVLHQAQGIIDEAMGRRITNQAMLQQLDMIRDAMYRGYYMLDVFRCQSLYKVDARDQYVPCGSKMIVVNQSDKITKLGSVQALTLNFLTYEAYWYFFKTITFGSTDPKMHPRLAYLAMEIARMVRDDDVPKIRITDVTYGNVRPHGKFEALLLVRKRKGNSQSGKGINPTGSLDSDVLFNSTSPVCSLPHAPPALLPSCRDNFQMEIVLSAVLAELTTRSINFFINKFSKPTIRDVEDRLFRILHRAEVIVDEATGRCITDQAMLQQLDMGQQLVD
ncbi:hypothetical protein PR202_gb12056 [Eleusine coracana subsp. coracana]|uniref:Rx N-terminal domain-containing protein n=1 Tax=Eleusine coracana subsp. coracana TaxID=191504 RepID=A0AAV5ENQ6_ELECO|nr:hypothetical protein PR202_gb12056 [Eleusine coracana subsp. coracana]